jgi:clan AA aspartic protease
MGTFRVRFKVSSLPAPDTAVEVMGLVDTGATFPFIPEQVLHSLGIQPSGEKTFLLADGSRKQLPIGEARLSYDGTSAPCLVVFAPQTAEPLFGALALESLGLEVDPVNRRLKPATLYLA